MFSVDVTCQEAEVWLSEHSPSSFALQNSTAFPLESWLCQAGRACPPPSPVTAERTCLTLFYDLKGDKPKWYQFSASLLPSGSKGCEFVASPKAEICLLWDVPECALCTRALSVVRNNMCLCLGDGFLLPIMFSVLQPCSFVASQICLATIHHAHFLELLMKKNGSKSCWLRQGKKFVHIWQSSLIWYLMWKIKVL